MEDQKVEDQTVERGIDERRTRQHNVQMAHLLPMEGWRLWVTVSVSVCNRYR